MKVEDLLTASLKHIKSTFCTLKPVDEHLRYGFFRASFIGPWWLRHSAMPSIALSGLRGWQGKKFFDALNATNILKSKNGTVEKLQMSCQRVHSLVDGQQSIALQYGLKAPLPWRWVVDELRVLDDDTFLCMTVIDLPLLRNFSFPFLLRREV